MQEIVYHTNYELENTYWWFVARNVIIKKFIHLFCNLKKNDTILDVGCGTGGFAQYISDAYNVVCVDTSELALDYCRKRGLKNLYNCYLADFPKEKFNIKSVLMLDVVEHIQDDTGVIKDVYNVLGPNGTFIATVPAYQWMWSQHDVVHMHYRRYNRKNFNKLLTDNGFEIVFSSYYNHLLFLPAVLKRFADFLMGNKKNDNPVDEVSPFLNKLFTKIFTYESKFLHFLKPPFGLSIVTIAKKVK